MNVAVTDPENRGLKAMKSWLRITSMYSVAVTDPENRGLKGEAATEVDDVARLQ